MNSTNRQFCRHHFVAVLIAVFIVATRIVTSKPETFRTRKTSTKVLAGGCPQVYVDSEAACAMHCYSNPWCRVYVLGSCDLESGCLCLNCQKYPYISKEGGEEGSVGTMVTPKRLVDGNSSLLWEMVHPTCTSSVAQISSTFGISPIKVLQLVAIETDTTGSVRYTASPVCPPTFTPRGQVYCESTNGSWYNQDTLACFSLTCTQNRDGLLYYAGYKNVTQSGRPCWEWSRQSPTILNYYSNRPFVFDHYDNKIAKNYCRTFPPEKRYPDPWCYIADYNVTRDVGIYRFEKCNIPECFGVY